MAKKEKDFDLENYANEEAQTTPQVSYKDNKYLMAPEAVQKAIGLPGIPLGYMSAAYGLSDCGKTGLMLNLAAQAQKQNILPIIIVTENKLTVDRIAKAGIDPKKAIIKNNLTSLEDVYDYISMKVQDVLDGKLPMDCMVFWDSVAGAPSRDSFEIDKSGKITKKFDNRKNANVIGYYNSIIASRVALTREVSSQHTVGVFMVTQAYIGEKTNPVLPPPLIPNGGEKIWFPLGLMLEIKEGMRLSAIHKGRKIEYGLISKLKVKKNHITEINCDGEVALLGTEIVSSDKETLDTYKEQSKERWNELLESAVQQGE